MAKEKIGDLVIEVEIDDSKVSKTLKEVKSDVNSSIKTFQNYDTALKNSNKTIKDFDKAIVSNGKAMNTLESSIKGIKNKIAELEKETNGMSKATQKQRDHYKSLSVTLSQAEANYKKLQKSSDVLKRQLAYEKNGVNAAEEAYKKLKKQQEITFSSGNKGIINAQKKLMSYRKEQKSLQSVIGTLKNNINDLSTEFGKNSDEVLEAQKKLTGYKRELKELNSTMKDARPSQQLGRNLDKISERSLNVGKSLTMGITAPIGTAFGFATKKTIDFEDQMISLRAVIDGDKSKVDELARASKAMSQEFGVSTSQINEGMIELAKTGYDASQIQNIVRESLKGSKASGEDFNSTMSSLISVMKTFGVSADNVDNVSSSMEQLVKVANLSSTGVDELGYALSIFGGTSKALDLDLAVSASAFGVLRDRGVQASTAATSLKSGLTKLAAAAKDLHKGGKLSESTVAFQKMGVNLEEVYQNGINLPKVLREMKTGLDKMTSANKTATIAQAMGLETVSSFTAFMDNSAIKSLESYTQKTRDSKGALNELMKEYENSPQGKINKLKESVNGLGLAIGEHLLPSITPLVESVTKLVQKFGNLNKGQQNFIVKVGLAAAAAGPLIMALGGIGRGLGGIIKNIGPIGLVSTAIAGIGAVALNSFDSFEQFKNTAVGCWNQIVASYNASGIKNTIDELGKNIGKLFGVNSSKDKKGGKGKGNDDGAKQDWVTKAREISDAVMPILNAILKTINSVTLALQKLPDGALPAIAGILPFIMVVRKLTRAFSATKNAITGTINKVKSIPNSFRTAKEQVTSLGNKFKGLKDKAVSLKDKIKGVNKSVKGIDDGTKESLNAVKKGLDNISDSADDAADRIGNVGDTVGEVSGIGGGGSSSGGSSSGKKSKKSKKGKKSKGGGKGKKGFKGKKGKGKIKLPGKIGKVASVALSGAGLFSNISGGLSETDSAGQGVIDTIQGVSSVLSFIPGPIGLGAKAVSLGAGAFDTLYNSSDGAREMVDGFCNKATEVFKGIPGTIKKFFSPGADEYKNKVDEMSESSEKSWKSTDEEFKEGTKKSAQKVKNWSAPKDFQTKYKKILELTKSFSSAMSKGISSMLDKLTHSIRRSRIGEAFTGVFTKGWNGIAGVLQDICNGSSWVLKELGVDSGIGSYGGKFKTKPVKYAKGTDGHPGGLMMVNDAPGVNYKELVIQPNGEAFVPEGKNVVMYGAPGTQVIRGEHTNHLMSMLNVPKYAKGTGLLNSSMSLKRKKGQKITKEIEDIFEYEDKPESLVDKVFKSYVGDLSGKGFAYQVASGVKKLARKGLIKKVKKGFEDALAGGDIIEGSWGDLGSNNWFQIHGCWVREWQYRLLEPIIKKYGFQVTDGGRRTWDNFDHSKGKAMDIALPNNPLGLYWKVAQQIDRMPLVSYVNSNLKSSYGHKGKFTPSNFEPRADHIHVSFVKELLTQAELRGNKGRRAGGSVGNPGGAGVARWRPYVIRALRANGLPTTPAYINAWMRQIQTESGGNPRAIGGNDGLNEGNAMGLLQVKPGTFAANKHAGHNNILNGYDNMLAAMRYAIRQYGYSGMLQAIGHGHGYENGGLITQHQIAELGEGNKPEMVIPLTDTSRSVQLIRQAQRFVGEEHFKKEEEYKKENNQLKEVIQVLNEQTQLLKALIMKDTDVYLDGNKVSSAMESRAKQMQLKRNIANGTI